MQASIYRGLTLLLVLFVLPAHAAQVTVDYVANVATSVGTPFGLSVPLSTEVTGSFTYETTTVDTNGSADLGDYPHLANGAFSASISGFATVITGSMTPFAQIENFSTDTFRFIDGPRPVGSQGGIMAINAVDDPDIQLWIAVSDGTGSSVADDDLPTVFSFDFPGLPHTFSLKDDQGTLLLQITGTTAVSPETWSRIKAVYR